jgi:hypothetical protein
MKVRVSFYNIFLLIAFGFFTSPARAQLLVEMIDTSAKADKGLWAVYKKSDHLQIGGYFNHSSR